MSQTTHSAITTWIWGLNIIILLTLFITLFSRHIAAAFPLFTNLVGFYLIRSVLLYVTFDHIDVEEYSRLYDFFLLLDDLVLIGLTAELMHSLVLEAGGLNATRFMYISGGILLASFGTWVLVRLMPEASIRLDRSQMFFSIVGVLLFLSSFRSSNYLLRTIAQGWGMVSIISLAANVGRVVTTAGDHPRRYAAWSYALAGGYLVTAVFWLVTLRAPVKRTSPAPLKVPD